MSQGVGPIYFYNNLVKLYSMRDLAKIFLMIVGGGGGGGAKNPGGRPGCERKKSPSHGGLTFLELYATRAWQKPLHPYGWRGSA